MKKILLVIAGCLLLNNFNPAFAEDLPEKGKVSLKTVGAGVLSLLVWPGIGQAINDNKGEKIITHAALGLLPPYRFWSAYDALVDRKDGYWKGRI